MILPIHLFINHFYSTYYRLQTIHSSLQDVESKIHRELKIVQILHMKNSQRLYLKNDQKLHLTKDQTRYEMRLDESKIDYGNLNQRLHICSLYLVELQRRRDFEKELRDLITKELEPKSSIAERFAVFANMSKNADLGIDGLSGRIKTQRDVVSIWFIVLIFSRTLIQWLQLAGLTAQRDSEAHNELARAANRDSKAIRIISVLTVFFLPGAYVAGLFATNMFTFKPGEAVRVYWAVVIPLTLLVVAVWLLWMWHSKNNENRPDEEKGIHLERWTKYMKRPDKQW
jgi:hypothetical protein